MTKRINQAQLARLCGVSRPTINKLVSKGIVRLDDDGLLDPDAAITAIAAHADQSQASTRDTIAARIASGKIQVDPNAAPVMPQAPAPKPAPMQEPGAEITSFQIARALREKFAALNERLEYETNRGDLIPRAAVKLQVFGLARSAQESLRAIADRIAPLVAAESDAHTCHQIIDAEIRIVMRQIAEADPTPPDPAIKAAA